jgi:hypothetical protein
MEQDHLDKAQGLAEAREGAGVGDEWVETSQEQAPAVSAFALIVEQQLHIRQESPVIRLIVPNAEQRWLDHEAPYLRVGAIVIVVANDREGVSGLLNGRPATHCF